VLDTSYLSFARRAAVGNMPSCCHAGACDAPSNLWTRYRRDQAARYRCPAAGLLSSFHRLRYRFEIRCPVAVVPPFFTFGFCCSSEPCRSVPRHAAFANVLFFLGSLATRRIVFFFVGNQPSRLITRAPCAHRLIAHVLVPAIVSAACAKTHELYFVFSVARPIFAARPPTRGHLRRPRVLVRPSGV